MDKTAASVSISLSKDRLEEEMSMSYASMGDALARLSDNHSDDAISNERILRGDDLLGTYKVLSDPIEGGMGSVYRVHHVNWDMDLAMKRPKAVFFAEAGDQRKASFIEECDHWIRLGLHPNIVSCYYVREIGGVPSIFSEWMDGGSLKDRIRDGSLYEGNEQDIQKRILDVAIQAARGLKYSHESGLIHQDVKPGNILLTQDRNAKVADFGIAQLWQEDSAAKKRPSGYTPQYSPAEQVAGDKPERWMDVYAFALTVLEMYIGQRLWETGADAGAGAAVFYNDERCRVRVPEAMRSLLDRCLTGKPDGFADVEAELRKIYREETGRTYPRTEAKAASDTPDSLNNRALSFLDLGQPAESLKLWDRALYMVPGHVKSRFNRELWLLRNGDKKDYEAIDALVEDKDCRRADAAADILHEWDRTRTPIPDAAVFGMENCATSAALSKDYIVFAFGDSNAAFSEERPNIRRVRRDGQGGYECDDLSSARVYRSKIMKIALHPGGEMAALLLENGTLCLYDIQEKSVLRAVHTLPEDYIDGIISRSFYLKCSFSPDGRILAIHNEQLMRESVFMEIPSMRVIAGIPMDFCAFSRDSLPLVIGRTGEGPYAIFEVDLEGQRREVFRFGIANAPEQYITKKITACPLCPFLSFNVVEYGPDGKTEETFYLDEKYQKLNLEEDPGRVLFIDPERHLLYSAISVKRGSEKRELMAVKDSRTLKMLFSVEMAAIPNILLQGVLCDFEREKILMWVTWTENGGKTGWSEEAPFPSVTKNAPASYRLSEIVTEKERSREDEILEGFLTTFRQAEAAGNYKQALDVFREARKIRGFYGSASALEMHDALEHFAERFALRSLHQIEELPEIPENYYTGKQIYRCKDGLVAVYDREGIAPRSREIKLYRSDGTLVRSVEVPDFANGYRIKNERVYAWIGGTFHAAVYDLEGNLLHAGPEGWPPARDRFSDYRSPHTMDIDSSGRYMLFGMRKLNVTGKTAPETGIFEIDLDTGHMIRLADYVERYDKYKKYGYFDDDTLLIRTGNMLSRFEKGTGRKLRSYRITEVGRAAFIVVMNPDRDRFFVTVLNDSLNPIALYAFNKDGKQLYHESGKNLNTDTCWFPGNRFACISGKNGFQIRDFEKNTVAYEAEASYFFSSMSPDGQIIYVGSGTGNKRKYHVYELEFDYKVRGDRDPGEKLGLARLIRDDAISEEMEPESSVPVSEGKTRPQNAPVLISEGNAEAGNAEAGVASAQYKTKYAAIEHDETVLTREDMLNFSDESTVAVPDGIRSIGAGCFRNRKALEKVVIPEGVREISNEAFMNCHNLTSVSIPGTVARIGREAFRGCKNLQDINLPEALEELGASAFMECENLKSVEIPAGVREIRRSLFSGCRSLSAVSLPEKLLKIEEGAFQECSVLRELVIPDSVFSIHGRAFQGCESLAYVRLPKNLRYVDDRMFDGFHALKEIEIPEGVTEIEEEAFCGCSSMTSLRFPKSLRIIGKNAFYGCSSLEELSMPDGCTEIKDGAFARCDSLKSATLSDTIRTIGRKAFSKCGQLETVKFPRSLEVIWDNAFENCTALQTAEFSEGLKQISHCAFMGCSSLSKIRLPETLTHIGIDAFSGDNLEGTVYIPSNVETIREDAFGKNFLIEAFEVSPENKTYKSCDGVLFEGKKLISCSARKTGKYSIPEWVQEIEASAFSGCRDFTEIVIPDGVLIIRGYAFKDCTGLTFMRIPATVSKMSESAFAGCTSIERYEVEEGSPYFKAPGGILMSMDERELVCIPPAGKIEYKAPLTGKSAGASTGNSLGGWLKKLFGRK